MLNPNYDIEEISDAEVEERVFKLINKLERLTGSRFCLGDDHTPLMMDDMNSLCEYQPHTIDGGGAESVVSDTDSREFLNLLEGVTYLCDKTRANTLEIIAQYAEKERA